MMQTSCFKFMLRTLSKRQSRLNLMLLRQPNFQKETRIPRRSIRTSLRRLTAKSSAMLMPARLNPGLHMTGQLKRPSTLQKTIEVSGRVRCCMPRLKRFWNFKESPTSMPASRMRIKKMSILRTEALIFTKSMIIDSSEGSKSAVINLTRGMTWFGWRSSSQNMSFRCLQ